MTPLLSVHSLSVRLPGGKRLVDGVDLELDRGRALALVGPSGAGKSTTLHALLGLVPPGATLAGSIRIEGEELAGAPPERWRRVRGRRIGLLPQEPLAALDPVRTIGSQLVETLRAHRPLGTRAAREHARAALEELGVSRAAARLEAYSFELSGGERQRVALALALAGDPALLLADEPTSALDRPLARDVVRQLVELRERRGLALLVVTHDLDVAASVAGGALVLDAGRAVESAATGDLLSAPASEVARRLLAASTRLGREVAPC